jgi:nitroreductase
MAEPLTQTGEQLGQESSSVLEQLLESRFSCRAFRSEPVDLAVIQSILTMAQRTASWCNSQAWQVAITSGQGTERFREVLYDAASRLPPRSDIPEPSEYVGVYQERRRAAGYGLYDSLGITREDKGRRGQQMLENYRLFGAPHVAVITAPKALGPYGLVDTGGYVSTFLLAAESVGVAAIPQAAIAMYSNVAREHFGFDDDRSVVCGISFGYADMEHPANGFRTDRAGLDTAVQWVDA